MNTVNQEKVSDILNIQGEDIPGIDAELDALLELAKHSEQKILPGASDQMFAGRKPYATTSVRIDFDNEADLRRCVRLLRWSDERLLAMGSTIAWTWDKTVREGMTIRFAVNWYDKDFFEKRKNAIDDGNHLSYFQMFGKSKSDMHIETKIVGS